MRVTERPPTAAPVAVGVDVGGTKCLGVALDAGGMIVAEHRVPTPEGAEAVIEAVAEVVACLPKAPAVGVGVPGLVDGDGVLRFAANLAGVEDLAVRAELEQRLPGVVVRVDNDANCAAWAEHRAQPSPAGHSVLATLGTGIGGGVVCDGRLLRGAHGFAGEIGHMVVVPGGAACSCGKRGCWERYASGDALGRAGREAAAAGDAPGLVELAGGDPAAVRGEHVTAAAAAGDGAAGEVVSRFAWWVALGLANLAELLDPAVFILGGGVIEAGDVVLAPASAAYTALVQDGRRRPKASIVGARLGEHAGAVGAARLAVDDPA